MRGIPEIMLHRILVFMVFGGPRLQPRAHHGHGQDNDSGAARHCDCSRFERKSVAKTQSGGLRLLEQIAACSMTLASTA